MFINIIIFIMRINWEAIYLFEKKSQIKYRFLSQLGMFLFPSNLFNLLIDSPWPLPVEPRKTRTDVKYLHPFMPWNWSFSPKKNRFEQVPGSSRRQKKLGCLYLNPHGFSLILYISNHLSAHVFTLNPLPNLDAQGFHSWSPFQPPTPTKAAYSARHLEIL